MKKVFEDVFSELQTDMVSICLEYVEDKAERIYIYCSFEANMISADFFYKINGKIVHKHKLNDVLNSLQKKYDVSFERQKEALTIIVNDVKALIVLFKENKRQMPTEIKLIYDAVEKKLSVECNYELMFSNSKTKTSDDVFDGWYQQEKGKLKKT